MHREKRRLARRCACALLFLLGTGAVSALAQTRDPLLDMLVHKGVIAKGEADHIAASPPDQQRGMLALLLERKGVLTPQDIRGLGVAATAPTVPAAPALPAAIPTAAVPPVAPPQQSVRRASLADRASAANPRQSANDAPYTDVERREAPLSFRIGGAEFTPGGFMDFATIFRSTNTGNPGGTNFFAIPFSNTVAGHLTETRFSAQNSQLNLKMQDRMGSNAVLAFVSLDFLGNDAANVFVSSNSHTVRIREGWADVRRGDWELLAGQVWGLQTPNRSGVNTFDSTIFTTYNEDFNYQVGLPWTRAPALRGIYHPSANWAVALEVQNPEQFGGQGEVTFPVAFNPQLGGQIDQASITSTPNLLPDFIVKTAYDSNPGGAGNLHLGIGGLVSTFKITDLVGGSFVHHTKLGGGGLGEADLEVVPGLHVVANALGGKGVGRYLFGMGPDLVVLPNAAGTDVFIADVGAVGGIGGLELHPWQSTVFAAYYGAAYFDRNFALDTTSPLPGRFVGFGGPNSANNNNKSIQEASLDWVQNWWSNQQYGTIQTTLQGSYLTRAPWFVAAGAPKNAHLLMGWFSLKYILPQ